MSLFRREALQAKQTPWLGEIVLLRPLSFSLLTGFAAIRAALIVAFLITGTYTQRKTVSGQLVPYAGVIKVYPPQPGVVLQKKVAEGQSVAQGDVLYVLSSERQSRTLGDTQAAISRHVEYRQHSLREEIDKTQRLYQEERGALTKKIADFDAELAKLNGQIQEQQRRAGLAKEAVTRYQGLLAQDYISKEQLQQRQAEWLDQRARLKTLERERIAVARERTAVQKEAESLQLTYPNRIAAIERALSQTAQELTESEAKRQWVITAPESGHTTAVIAEVGQALDGSKPLVSIIPAGAQLQARLYAPSRAVGFIQPGDTVMPRYAAFPYQKFGQHRGVVVAVAKTALPSTELADTNAEFNTTEPVYGIAVTLPAQTIQAYGTPQSLQAGMLLEADILQDTRRLYEWVLEPLYSLTGKL